MIQIHELSSIYTYETDKKTFSSGPPRGCHTLAYQVSGSYEHFFLSQTLSVKSDTLFFINKNDTYNVRRVEHGYSICITFTADIDFSSCILDCSNDPQVYNLFQKLLRVRNLDVKSNRCLATAIVYEVFSVFYKQKESAYVPSTTRGKIELARNHIRTHYRDEEFQAQSLAKLCGVGVKRFRELFKQLYKTTPTQYVIDLRLNAATKLLTDGNFNVSTVAEMVGFSDVYYFSRLFKKRFGIAPKQFQADRRKQ